MLAAGRGAVATRRDGWAPRPLGRHGGDWRGRGLGSGSARGARDRPLLAKPPVPECCAGCLGLPALVRPSVLGRSLPPEGSSSTLAWGSALGFRVGAAPPLPASNPGGHAMLSSDAIGRGPAPMEAGCFAPPGGWRPCPGSSLVAQQQQVRIHFGPSHYGLTVFLVTQLEFLSSAFAAALSALAPCTAPFASDTTGGGTGATPSG